MEPIQGEGGIIPSDPDWLKTLRKRCDDNGVLLIFDEIQSGFGRTGKLFAFQHYGVVPDIMTTAKAMGGGMPVGGIISSTEIFGVFRNDPPLNHVTTFGGHPVSCAAGLAALRVLLREDLPSQAKKIEQTIRKHLEGENLKEIRGMGAMLGLELHSSDQTAKLVKQCFSDGLILGWTLHSNSLIRIAPPLNIPEETLEKALEIIKNAFRTS